MSKRSLALISATMLIIAAGAAHGVWTNRWGAPAALRTLADRMQHLPRMIGPWVGEDVPRSNREWLAAGAVGHLNRIYTRQTDGAKLTLMLVAGLSADISSHTPEVCYPSAGYVVDKRERVELGSHPAATFYTARARLDEPNSDGVGQLQIFWSWNNGHKWQAPEDPRLSFMGERVLTKLYVIIKTDGSSASQAPAHEFLHQLLPLLEGTLPPVSGTSHHGSTT